MSIVLQVEGLDEKNILQHPLLSDQFFYRGNIPWRNVKKLLVRDHDEDAEKRAKDIAVMLKRDHGLEIGIETYDPSIGLERKWGRKQSQEKEYRGPIREKNFDEIKIDKLGEKRRDNFIRDKDPNKY